MHGRYPCRYSSCTSQSPRVVECDLGVLFSSVKCEGKLKSVGVLKVKESKRCGDIKEKKFENCVR